MKTKMPLVDQFGNINAHVLDDLYIPILPPEGQSLSGRKMSFEVVGYNIKFKLVDMPGVPGALLINMPASALSKLPEMTDFALVDYSPPATKVKWFGKMRRFK